MARKTKNALEILDRLTGDDPELLAMIAEETRLWQDWGSNDPQGPIDDLQSSVLPSLPEVSSMARIRWQDHIVMDEDLHHGDPCIKGTRIPVKILIGSLADGMTPEEILASYPQLSGQDLLVALAYAADVLSHEVVAPLASRDSANAHQGR